MLRTILLLILTTILGAPGANRAAADERYYMMIFGSETRPHAHRYTHTFALFAKATGDVSDPKSFQLETQTISWMPRTLAIRVLARNPEPGVNLSVDDSIRWANSVGAGVWMWGPFEVRKELYDMAAAQAARLNAGQMMYLCIDRNFRGRGASNCIHAVMDLDTTQPMHDTGRQSGNAGSGAALRHLSKHVVPSEGSKAWLVERLGLMGKGVSFMSPEAQPSELQAQTGGWPVRIVTNQ